MPDLNMSCKCQRGEPKRLKRHHCLEKDDRFPFIPALHKHTCWQCQEQGRQCGRKTNQSQVKRAAGNAIRQIRLGCVLHPCADDGEELSNQEQDIVGAKPVRGTAQG